MPFVVTRRVEHRDLSLQSATQNGILRVGEETYIACLDKVASDEKMLSVGRDLYVVRAYDRLLLIRRVESLDVAEIRDVEGRDVVAQGHGKVGELAVRRDVRVNSHGVLRLGAKIVQELRHALVAIGVLPEGVDNPD